MSAASGEVAQDNADLCTCRRSDPGCSVDVGSTLSEAAPCLPCRHQSRGSSSACVYCVHASVCVCMCVSSGCGLEVEMSYVC